MNQLLVHSYRAVCNSFFHEKKKVSLLEFFQPFVDDFVFFLKKKENLKKKKNLKIASNEKLF
jgi:hypothetical protein